MIDKVHCDRGHRSSYIAVKERDEAIVAEIAYDLDFVAGDNICNGGGGIRWAAAERDEFTVAEIANDLEYIGVGDDGDVGNGKRGVGGVMLVVRWWRR